MVPLVRLGKSGCRHLAPDLIHDRVDTAPNLHVARASGRHAG
ncbi:hypothetical protein Q2941_05540 [Bradyrhizobium sp. UFLA05-153]|nr:hypothetical protein [Bradyrhizobium sp. Ec3.3]